MKHQRLDNAKANSSNSPKEYSAILFILLNYVWRHVKMVVSKKGHQIFLSKMAFSGVSQWLR